VVAGGTKRNRLEFREAREEERHPNRLCLGFYAAVARYGQR